MNWEAFITCAVTGAGDTTAKHPAIPVTPEEIATAAIEAARAGAAIAHIHVRDPETGKGARDPALYREVVERMRAADTDVVLNLTPDKQHTNGANWPVMLLGNLDGAFKTGCFTQLDGTRPINALYATLLRAAGQNCDRFNMNEKLAKKFDSSTGPVKELLV